MDKIEKLEKIIKKQKRIIEENYLLRRMLIHELINPLGTIKGFTEILEEENTTKEEQKKYISIIKNAGESLERLTELLEISEITEEEILKNSKKINFEKIAKESAIRQINILRKEKINLRIFYNKSEQKPLEIYSNEGIIEAFYNTLIGNSLNYALPESEIKQAIRINEENRLEILLENLYAGSPLRKVAGTGIGIGTIYTKKIINLLKGNLINYDKPKIKEEEYEFSEIYGAKNIFNKQKGNLWGVKIEIPL